MKSKNYANENKWPSRSRFVHSPLVCIETAGYSGTGYITLPAAQLVRSRWLGHDILREWVLEGAVQVMRAVLASDRYAQDLPPHTVVSLTEFEDLRFESPMDARKELQFVVRIHSRFGNVSRGRFTAYQGVDLIAAGKVVVKEG